MSRTTTPEPLVVDVDDVSSGDHAVPDVTAFSDWCRHALDHARPPDRPVSLAVRVVDEAEGRELNARYRGSSAATNVLSFPSGLETAPPGEPLPIGDIVLCAPVVVREAREQGKRATDHWCHLVVHGVLHLLGYDHGTDAEAGQMEAIERQILEKYGISDPYEFTPSIIID